MLCSSPVHVTMSGHRSISAQFIRMTDHMYTCTLKMSGQGTVVKRCSALKTTGDKWIAENDKALNTTVWLKYDTDPTNCTCVLSLKCSICVRSSDPCQYAPIATALNIMDTAGTTRCKFDITYTKIWQSAKWGLCVSYKRGMDDLGSGYKNEKVCATFVDFILLDQ